MTTRFLFTYTPIGYLWPRTPRSEFELGLELDSAEVRGVLIYQGQDWGRVVFDYRS